MDDLELRLLAGVYVDVPGIGKLYPLKLREIVDIGEKLYNQYLGLVLSEQSGLKVDGIDEEYDSFDMMMVQYLGDPQFQKFMSLLFRETLFVDEQGFFYVGDDGQKVLSRDNVGIVRDVLKKQNFIKEKAEEEREYRPANDKARKFIEKMKQFKEKIKQQNHDDGLRLSDIVSIVASYSGSLNIINIWDITVYELYDNYIRLLMKDNYDTQIYLLPHSSSDKSPELKHWATKINN